MQTMNHTNPFTTAKPVQSGIMFNPDDYSLGRLVNLPPNATRVLFIMAANMDKQTGLVHCPPALVKKYLPQKGERTIRSAITQLLQADLIARSKGVSRFWVNPSVFARFTFEIR